MFLGRLFQAISNFFASPNTPVLPPKPPDPGRIKPETPNNGTIANLLLQHNSQRGNNKVPFLSMSLQLTNAAQNHADWMALNRQMSHNENNDINADISKRLNNNNYNFTACGENIAAGQSTVTEVMNSWMNSPGHRANILNSQFWHVGFGVAQDVYSHIYWCVVFASPLHRGTEQAPITIHIPEPIVKN